MAELYKRPGNPYWYANLHDPRDPRGLVRKSTKRTIKSEAREVARALQEEIEAQCLAETPTTGLFWENAFDAFVTSPGLKDSTRSRYTSASSTILQSKALGNFDLGSLTPEKLKAFTQEMRLEPFCYPGTTTPRRRTDATIKVFLTVISAVYRYVNEYQLEGSTGDNPVSRFDRSFLRSSPVIDRHLREMQWADVMSTCQNDEHRHQLTILVGTGLRPGELIQLAWPEVDLERNFIEFGTFDPNRTKRSRSRRIPILAPVKDALLAQLATQKKLGTFLRDGLVFPSNVHGGERYSLSYLMRATRKRSGIKGYTNYALRHTFASWCLQRGMDPIGLRDLLGHSTLSTSTRYARHTSDSVADKFRTLDLPIATQFVTQSRDFSEGDSPKEEKT